jgi:glutathione S-transferase
VALRLLHFEGCPFCDKVRRSLRRMSLDFESVPIEPGDRAEVERISGQRLVPVLCDDDRVIPDSTRILRYLVARYGERGLLPPGPADQAMAWIVEDYADEVLGPLVYALLKGQGVDGRPLPARERQEMEKHLETQHRNLEQLFSQRPFVLGDSPTLADIAVFCFVAQIPRYAGREVSAGFPHLRAWYQRMDRD